MSKNSFILHNDSLDVLDELTNEQAGMLLKAMRAFHCGQEIELDTLTKIVFSPFKNQFDRDEVKYQKIVNRNKTNGLKGGRPSNPVKANKPSGLSGNPSKPKEPDSVNVNVNDSVNVSVIDKEKITPSKLDFSVLQMTDIQCKDVIRIRKKNKGTTLTQLIVDQLAKQFLLAEQKGFSFQDSLIEWEVRGWKSFKAEWMKSKSTAVIQRPVSNTEFFQ